MSSVKEKALDLLFPKRCPWCGGVVGYATADCCAEQATSLRLAPKPCEAKEYNRTTRWLGDVWAVYSYEGVVREGIHHLKFDGAAHSAQDMAGEMAALARETSLHTGASCVTPVPLSKASRQERGYDQAALLAKHLAKALELEYAPNLTKIQDTPRQSGLTKEKRAANVLGAFSVHKPEWVNGRHILLVDDVITTGATLDECAKLLLAAGATRCTVLCLASTAPDAKKKREEGKIDGEQ